MEIRGEFYLNTKTIGELEKYLEKMSNNDSMYSGLIIEHGMITGIEINRK